MYVQVEKSKENKNQVADNFISQKKCNGKQALGFLNDCSVDVTQRKVQLMADYSVQRQKHIPKSSFPKAPLQLRVAVTSDNKDKADYVTLNSIAFGETIAGGDVENFNSAKFSSLNAGEKIAMVGHGEQGKSGNYTGRNIAEKLTVGDEKMPDGNHEITFTSCCAGQRTQETKFDSVIDIVKDFICKKWQGANPAIKGAMGPSIKTISLNSNEAWGVVKPEKTSKDIAGKVQQCLNKRYNVDIRSTPAFNQGAALKDKARYVQDKQQNYFMDFVNLINGEWEKVDKSTQEIVTQTLTAQELTALKNGNIRTDSRIV